MGDFSEESNYKMPNNNCITLVKKNEQFFNKFQIIVSGGKAGELILNEVYGISFKKDELNGLQVIEARLAERLTNL